MALPISIPYSFQNATAAIPLSQLDTNFATVQVAINSMGNGTFALSNVNITGGNISGLANPITVGNGGTGYNSLTANSLLVGNGNAAVQLLAPGTSGNILYSNGTAWTSTAFIPQPGTAANVLTSNGTAWISQSGFSLPSQTGNAGTVLKTNGSTTSWNTVVNAQTVATPSGVKTVDFTGIPSWVKRITVIFRGISLSGNTDDISIRLGTASGFATSGYVSTSASQAGGTTVSSTTMFVIGTSSTSTDAYSGNIIITNITSNAWVLSSTLRRNTGGMSYAAGDVSLSDVLTQLRVMTTGTADNFDAGSVNVFWE